MTGILITLILLGICITVDSAEETISNTDNQKTNIKELTDKNTIIINDTYYVGSKNDGMAVTDGKIHTDKTKTKKKTKSSKNPTVTITARPSCGCHYSYKWRTNTFTDYCPHCHHYNCLRNVHKWQAKHEQELTCTVCGADYCGQCGKEKYGWSNYRITKA